MIDAKDIDPQTLRSTMRLICEEILRRGWGMTFYYTNNSQARVQRPDGKIFDIFSSIPPTTTFSIANRSDDKYLTYTQLRDSGIPMPTTTLVSSWDEALMGFRRLRQAAKNAVIKPLNQSHGNGVSVNIGSEDALTVAYRHAAQFSDVVLLQEYTTNQIDLRIVCIDYVYQAALRRVPARVKGDGVSTVGELIERENASEHRGINYKKDLNIIPIETAKAYLGQKWYDVSQKDQWHQAIGVANVGMGGETIDVTDDLPEWLIQMAQKIAISLELSVCGVDILVSDMPASSSTQAELQPLFIEANKGPSLFIHDQPIHGRSRPVTAAYVDYLAKI